MHSELCTRDQCGLPGLGSTSGVRLPGISFPPSATTTAYDAMPCALSGDHMHPHHDNNRTCIFTFLLTKTLLLSTKPFRQTTSRKLITIMPLVVPGLTSNSGDNDQTNKWMNQLMGKKIGDQSNETVSRLLSVPMCTSWSPARSLLTCTCRLSPKPTSQRSTVCSRRATCPPWTTSLTGTTLLTLHHGSLRVTFS
jgi:hypothetical protein